MLNVKKDTEKALEIIAPMAKELGIEVKADDTFLYCNGQAIRIGCNSTHATLTEFIEYAFKSEHLKPCPFCGGKAEILHLISCGQLLYWPRCKNCDAVISTLFDTIADAISAWNRRADK